MTALLKGDTANSLSTRPRKTIEVLILGFLNKKLEEFKN
jgi:hypothetical protein